MGSPAPVPGGAHTAGLGPGVDLLEARCSRAGWGRCDKRGGSTWTELDGPTMLLNVYGTFDEGEGKSLSPSVGFLWASWVSPTSPSICHPRNVQSHGRLAAVGDAGGGQQKEAHTTSRQDPAQCLFPH